MNAQNPQNDEQGGRPGKVTLSRAAARQIARTGALIACLLLLAVPAAGGYVLHHPHREHCRRGYVRRHEHKRVLCVRVKPAPVVAPSAPPAIAAPQGAAGAPTPTPPTAPSAQPTEAEEAAKLSQAQKEAAEWADPEPLPVCTSSVEATGEPCEEP